MRRSSVLAVLTLLFTGAQAQAGESLPALEVEGRFACAPRQPLKLELVEGMRSLVEVPEGCPGAGERFFVSLECRRNKPCQGSAFVRDYVAAYLQGPRGRVRPTNLQPEAPQALEQLQLRVRRATRLEVDESLLQYRAVDVWVAHREQRVSYRLASGGAGVVRLQGTPRGRQVAMALQVDRTKKESVRLRVVLETGKLLLDEELALGVERELDCAASGLACSGPVRLGVRDAAGTSVSLAREVP
jgi:hypothetical protein